MTAEDRLAASDQLDLLVVGDLNPDVIVSGPDVQPRFGQAEQLIDSATLVVGGSAAITAMGAARLGLRVGLMAMIGQDDLGQLMTVRLAEAGVDLQHVCADGSLPTGVTVILNDSTDRAVFTAPGAIASLSPIELDALPDRPARHVHAASFYLMSKEFQMALPDTFERFHAAEVTTSLDTNWDPEQRWELSSLLDHTDVFLPNESEIAALAGSTILDRAVEVVAEHGCDVVVKRGKLGAVAQVGARTFRVSRTPPTEYVDAVGAGDTFDAGYLAGKLQGLAPAACLAMAVIAGSLSTSAAGGTAGQPEKEDIDAWMSSVPVIEGEGAAVSSNVLDDLAQEHRNGRTPGLTSVCSAHPLVLDEAVRLGAAGGHVVLIEATCNQVNQEGGYTGLQPAAFRRQVEELAERYELPTGRLVFGGDHLGPNPWKHLPVDAAMVRAVELVQAYVEAGYTKIHLDASMPCADDLGTLSTEVVAQRAARLAAAAEAVAPDRAALRYVIGTEVPVPGGESAGSHGIHVSTTADVEETLELSRNAFEAVDIESAWERVRTVVAQPGVEFSDEELYTYTPGQAKHLESLIHGDVPFVFEAHSTDYQPRTALRGLVDDHFAILKVGPGLTFAYREALLALSYIEDEVCHARASGVWHVLEQAMLSNPTYWQPFYSDDSTRAALSRSYSRSDRSRYYWPVPEVQAAVELMRRNLDEFGLPDEMVSQYLSWLTAEEVPGAPQTTALGERLTAGAVLRAAVRRVLTTYNAECTPA